MAVPKYRKSKSKTMMRRRSNDKRNLYATSTCSNCGTLKQPHRVCHSCGFYKGRQVIQVS